MIARTPEHFSWHIRTKGIIAVKSQPSIQTPRRPSEYPEHPSTKWRNRPGQIDLFCEMSCRQWGRTMDEFVCIPLDDYLACLTCADGLWNVCRYRCDFTSWTGGAMWSAYNHISSNPQVTARFAARHTFKFQMYVQVPFPEVIKPPPNARLQVVEIPPQSSYDIKSLECSCVLLGRASGSIGSLALFTGNHGKLEYIIWIVLQLKVVLGGPPQN